MSAWSQISSHPAGGGPGTIHNTYVLANFAELKQVEWQQPLQGFAGYQANATPTLFGFSSCAAVALFASGTKPCALGRWE